MTVPNQGIGYAETMSGEWTVKFRKSFIDRVCIYAKAAYLIYYRANVGEFNLTHTNRTFICFGPLDNTTTENRIKKQQESKLMASTVKY